jgi:hypothetical protein
LEADELGVAVRGTLTGFAESLGQMAAYATTKSLYAKTADEKLYWQAYIKGLKDAAAVARETAGRVA